MSGKRPAKKFKPVARPTPPRAKFTSLPNELVTQIAMLCDVRSAKSLARVCRAFTEPSMSRIWKHVDFTLDDKLYEPVPRTNKRVREAEDRYEVALFVKARTIKDIASKQKMGKITKVTLLPRAGVSQIMVDISEGAASTLKEMVIKGRPSDCRGDGWRPNDLDMLDLRLLHLLDRQITFPSLTYVQLDTESIRFSAFLALIIALAPNLTAIDLEICHTFSQAHAAFPAFSRPTKIRDARIVCYPSPGEEHEADRIAVMSLVNVSPDLQRLAVGCDGCLIYDQVLDTLHKHEKLQDFHWLDALHEFPLPDVLSSSAFRCLRRLLIHCIEWADVFRGLPLLPALEIVHFYRDVVYNSIKYPNIPFLQSTPTAGFLDPSPAQTMPRGFAMQLRHSPRLRIINVLNTVVDKDDLHVFSRLDDIERRNELHGYVRSFRHEGSELLHARMLLNYTWDAGAHVIDGIDVPGEIRGLIWHDDDEELMRHNTFPDSPATWRNFTDYEGKTVPLSIIQRMKEVEGAVGVWEGRGIEVGAAAWKVLSDWVEAQT